MDLDKSIDILIGHAIKCSTLDYFDDNLINNFDIASDAEGVRQIIFKNGYNYSLASRDRKFNVIVDVSTLLKEDDDYDFLELSYIKILNRPIELKTLKEMLNNLKEQSITREALLKILEDSNEGKDKQVFLTGFSEFKVSDYTHLNDINFIKILYIKILGRFADAFGLKEFLVRLKLKELTRNDIVKKIIYSDEAKNKIIPKVFFDINEKMLDNNRTNSLIKDKKARATILNIVKKDFDEYYELENKYCDLKKDIIELKKQVEGLFNEICYLRNLESFSPNKEN